MKALFVCCPPRHGSTVLATVLASSPDVYSKGPRGEFLRHPDLCHLVPEKRWNSKTRLPWGEIKGKMRQYGDRPIFMLKSPFLLAHLDELKSEFPGCKIVSMVRHPIIVAASYSRREEWPVDRAIRLWVKRAGYVRRAVEEFGAFKLTYRRFCWKTKQVCDELVSWMPELCKLDPAIGMSVHSTQGDFYTYGPMNLNHLHEERAHKIYDEAVRLLTPHRDLVRYFDYKFI